jgi:hypothetical protein
MVSSSIAVILLVVGLLVGAGVTFEAFPSRTTTTTLPQQTVTTTAPQQTITATTMLTLIQVPVIRTQVETLNGLVTDVETLTYVSTRTSTTGTSSPLGTIQIAYLDASTSTSVEAFYIPVGTLNVTLNSNEEVSFEIMSSALYNQFQNGESVPMCSTTSCNLNQNGAKVGVTSGSLLFQITSPGTYYTWVDNDYSGNGAATVSGSLGMVSQQTTTYVITSTSLYTTTSTNQTVTTITDTVYSTSTVG